MTWDDQPIGGADAPPTAATSTTRPTTAPNPFRRTLLTAGLAGALLVAGGVAAVAAASPDPSVSPAPAASDDPSSGGSTGPTRADRQHDGQPCPDDDGSGSGGSSGSDDGQTADPSPSTTTPATWGSPPTGRLASTGRPVGDADSVDADER